MKTQTRMLTTMAGEIVPRYVAGKPAAADMPKVTGSGDVNAYLRDIYALHCADMYVCESFVCLYLNRANRVTGFEVIAKGSATGCVVDIQAIFRSALKLGAQSLILAHNHPSGNLTPSQPDRDLTRKIKSAGEFLDIKLLDHLILTPAGPYYSFLDEGAI